MRALDRKLVRDLWRMRVQVVTIALVIASGIAAYVCLSGTYRALAVARATYYERHQFPDVFAHLERAPDGVADRLRTIPGVASLETRLVEPVRFVIPGMQRPPIGQAVSLPDAPDDAGRLRFLVLRAGRAPEPGRADEALVLESFASAHGLEPGDALDAVLGGRRLRLHVVGLALSPEWVFPIEAGVMDDRAFGIVWLGRDALAAASGKRAAFDDVTARLAPGADERAVLDALDRALARWGGGGAYGRHDQTSNRFLDSELGQLDVLATQVPAVFLIVAAFLLYIVLGRIVQLQREQLAVLRALGYTRGALARHVLGYAGAVVAIGVALGIALGIWLAGLVTALYSTFFHFPELSVRLDVGLVLTSVAVAVGAATFGALIAAYRVIRLAPAEAMRPPAPVRYRRGLLTRLGLARLAGPLGRMIVRDVERRPVSTSLSILGIAFAGAITVLGRFSTDSMDSMIDAVFTRGMREDVAVTMVAPVPRGELGWFRGAPGVLAAEPVRTLPVRLRAGRRLYDTALTAWPQGTRMRRVIAGDGSPVALPTDGVLLTDVLGARLGVGVGDRLTVERLDGDHRVVTLTVAGLVDELAGMNAYMDLDALTSALGEEPQMSTVLLDVDPARRDELVRTLADVPGVMLVMEPDSMRESFEAQSGETMLVWTTIVVVFGSVIAIGVVYNTARIALSERGRDLATLRVLGFTRDEVSVVLLGQLAFQVALAVPLGMLCGWTLATLFMSQLDPEMYRYPAVVAPVTYAFASLVVLGSALATSIVVRRKLDRIDIVSALKARD